MALVENAGERPWRSEDGAILQHGERLRLTYNDKTHFAEIKDGLWMTDDGRGHDSPSGAAVHVVRTKDGKTTHLDGWNYWQVFRGGRWIPIDTLRTRRPPPKKPTLDDL